MTKSCSVPFRSIDRLFVVSDKKILSLSQIVRIDGDKFRRCKFLTSDSLSLSFFLSCSLFLNMGQSRSLFRSFSSFSHSNYNNTNWKRMDVLHGIRTQCCRMVGVDDSTELCRPTRFFFLSFVLLSFCLFCIAPDLLAG